MGKAYAYRLIASASVIEKLSPIGDIPKPETESQARPLTKLPPEQQPATGTKVPLVHLHRRLYDLLLLASGLSTASGEIESRLRLNQIELVAGLHRVSPCFCPLALLHAVSGVLPAVPQLYALLESSSRRIDFKLQR